MGRSILNNPKSQQPASLKLTTKKGFITPYWQRRLSKFYRSIIPSHIPLEAQIWLTTPEEIVEFSERLNNPNIELNQIEYIVIFDTISDFYDIIDFFTRLRKKTKDSIKVIYFNYNWLWSPIFAFSGLIGFSRKRGLKNFYRDSDIDCFMQMSGWENVKRMKQYLLPTEIPIISKFLDNFLIKLPLLRNFALTSIFIARKSPEGEPRDYSVTVLIPCKNEENNVEATVQRMPKFGKSLELLFINDKSTDKTEEIILDLQNKLPEKNIVLVQGKGMGKGEAIREGMIYASGDICMILDADLTVIPEDLPQFYEAMRARRADFIHGTRLVYPQEEEAMRFANILGNVAFSIVFSYILDQRTTDTLCGTKVYWRKDWPTFEEMKAILKHTDVWGDYNLIFGASRYGLKISQLPVRYFERLEGVTKMTKRIRNGLIMLRVSWQALWQIKFL